jgi:hypothetical protein
MVGDTPLEFATALIKLYTDGETWERISQNGLLFITDNYSLEYFKKHLDQLVMDLDICPDFRNQFASGISRNKLGRQEVGKVA